MSNEINADARQEDIYQQAKDKYLHYAGAEDLRQAEEGFRQISDYRQSAAYIEKCETLLAYMPGCTVTFGQFEGAPIRWRVVDQRGKMRLLLAEDVVTRRCYHRTTLEDATWSDCSLRNWLNRDFLESAFTPAERMKIVPNKLRNLRNRRFYTQGGPDTMDRVHIPGVEEIERYLPEQADRAGQQWWWLRCPGSNLFSAVAVYDDGSIYENGIHIDYEGGGVRPAVWVLLKV